MAGQLHHLGLVRVKSQPTPSRSPAVLEPAGNWDALAVAGTGPDILLPPDQELQVPGGRVQLCWQMQALLLKGLCSPGEPVTPECTNPACYPLQHLGTGCCGGPNVLWSLVLVPCRSKSAGPFLDPTSCH